MSLYRRLALVIILMVIAAFVIATSAISNSHAMVSSPQATVATNGHQDHRGACARSTTSITKGIGDLRYNGVIPEIAGAFGIHGYDGSLTKQMKNRLAVATVAHSVTTANTGCNGYGGTFPVGPRKLYKGEKVIIKVPAKYGKDVCARANSRKCKKVCFTVSTALPASCWNLNKGPVKACLWVLKHQKPKHQKPKRGKPKQPHKPPNGTCNGDNTNNGNGSAGNCNVNVCVGKNVCNHQENPPCTQHCEEDQPPQISCIWPPHIYEGGGSLYIWCEAHDPNGDTITVNIAVNAFDDWYAHISSVIPVTQRWNTKPCPSDVSCFRATLWGDHAGEAHIVATATANGKSATSPGKVTVKTDDFP